MAMKRMREDHGGKVESLDMADCLMLLSHGLAANTTKPKTTSKVDVFECKTCNRQFTSFQALGGHRASHKRPRLMGPEEEQREDGNKLQTSGKKPKMHECSICGLKFAMGQALGGHMRRHRPNHDGHGLSYVPDHDVGAKVPVAVMKRSNSSKRVVFLDLNLTPLENDLNLLFGKMAPKVDLRLMI
ncbi:hypothetical protein F2P56_007750 [Juglans regia]|uniref:C2H2-type domain-containing protein n=2 Tax=Juglans regia TaxID=51240 RepID=A0A833Y2S1_JUGRE|nr:zinc finger protein ZAT11-like [Juglans regia]KAF5476002.1 hypothetical protein F2P56_007750 [Juglans regia]